MAQGSLAAGSEANFRVWHDESLPDGYLTQIRRPLAFLAVYAIALLALLPKLSLWLDEIIDLHGVRDLDLRSLIAYVPRNAGGVPLGYLTQALPVRLLGFSAFSGRLPSAIASLAAALGILITARRVQLRYPLLAVAVFCLLPLQFRYALEARSYSEALAISIWATVVFLGLRDRVTPLRMAAYLLLILAGLYTQPYSFFVPLVHIGFAAFWERDFKLTAVLAVTALLAVAGFFPWYEYSRSQWMSEAHSYKAVVDWNGLKLVLKELTGAGYAGTAVVICLVVCALAERRNGRWPGFFLLYLVVPLVGALAGDVVFGYFVAIRQMIFVVTSLAILCALGLEHLSARTRVGATALLMVVFLIADINLFLRPREDWNRAAGLLLSFGKKGTCIVFDPADSVGFYQFFSPNIERYRCIEPGKETTFVLAVSPYPSGTPMYNPAGYVKTEVLNAQGPRVEVWARSLR